MAHLHSIYDTDKHFKIDPITRNITSESTKTTLMQYDHNSERFTFEIPRYIEGHDMSLSDTVRIHYINIGSSEKEAGIYEVDDVQISPDSDDVVIFSWLVSRNSTKFSGRLNFTIRFNCTENEELEYSWGTGIFAGIKVSNGLDNSEIVVENYVDILEQWKKEFLDLTDGCYTELTRTQSGKLRVWVKGGKPGEQYVVIPAKQSRKNGIGPLVYPATYHNLVGFQVYPGNGSDLVFGDYPEGFYPYSDASSIHWLVTISEKYKNGFVDIDLGKFLVPFLRPAFIDGTKTHAWINNGTDEEPLYYGRFIGEGYNFGSPVIFKFIVLPYNEYLKYDTFGSINLDYFGKTSSNFLKIGANKFYRMSGDGTRYCSIRIVYDENKHFRLLTNDLYVSIL